MRVVFAMEAVEAAALVAALGDSPGAAVVASALLEVPAPLEPVWDAAVL